MEFITGTFAWVVANSDVIFATWLAVHAAALAIVNLTPTPKDNEVLAKVYSFVSVLAGLFTKEAQGTK